MTRLDLTGHWQPPGGAWTEANFPAHKAALKAAADRAREYTRLYTRCGQVAHLMPPWRGLKGVLCPVVPRWDNEWLGTGSQAEYELAAEMSTCKRCYALFMASVRCGNPECGCQEAAA